MNVSRKSYNKVAPEIGVSKMFVHKEKDYKLEINGVEIIYLNSLNASSVNSLNFLVAHSPQVEYLLKLHSSTVEVKLSIKSQKIHNSSENIKIVKINSDTEYVIFNEKRSLYLSQYFSSEETIKYSFSCFKS